MATATSPAPSIAIGPRLMLWTCTEFHRFGDLGLFEGRRALLIDGVLMEQGPMNPPHAIALGLVQQALLAIFGGGWWLRVQLPLVLGQWTDPLPDLALVAGTPRQYATHPVTAELVVEIADTSLRFDTTDKRLLYATAGVRDYWVLDVNGRELLVYRDPQPMGSVGLDYAQTQRLADTDFVSPLAMPSARILVADLLP